MFSQLTSVSFLEIGSIYNDARMLLLGLEFHSWKNGVQSLLGAALLERRPTARKQELSGPMAGNH